jgi:hypothetical protein
MIKSRIAWARQIAEGLKMHTKFWSKNLKEINHLEDQGVDKIIC